ncbi:glycosyltransferase family 4 protein [Endozoicomonas lisbonensis]|uniref:Glycosyltransferase involved in cell wall biosynthesis n=1 Tax=Endozoicomonas lisbonensis TaxID=3120522 RepID=A0ABV2SP16_9GAMM
MKVIFDCTALSNWHGHATGIQRVVSEIGKELKIFMPKAYLGLFREDGFCYNYSLESRTTSEILTLNTGDIVITAGSNWDYPSHHKRLLSLDEQGVSLCTLFYDIIPVLLPFSYGPGFASVYEEWLKETLKKSAVGFSISENTRVDLEYYSETNNIQCPPVYVVRLGDDIPDSTTSPSDVILEKTVSPFILSVGTIEYRKNHVLLLNTYRYLIERMNFQPPKLYLVGKKGWLDHDIEYQITNDILLNEYIEILHDISDADLKHLYQESLFTVYPSYYEGWGLPVAESLCFGKPCIASRSSSMLEIAPGLVRHADPFLVQEWAEQIRTLVEDSSLRQNESKHISNNYQRNSWTESAKKIKMVLLQHYPQLAATSG